MEFEEAAFATSKIFEKQQENLKIAQENMQNDERALLSLLELRNKLSLEGFPKTADYLEATSHNYALSDRERSQAEQQLSQLRQWGEKKSNEKIENELVALLGSPLLVKELSEKFSENGPAALQSFLEAHQNQGTGRIFSSMAALHHERILNLHVQDTENSLSTTLNNHKSLSALVTDVDLLTRNYKRGKELYLAQACYACHRIAGLARGGVGPELTTAGNSYPWFIKESIVWPQADVKDSKMPNMRLDHQELEDLMTFILAQKGQTKAVSDTQYRTAVQTWEAGRKMPWETPLKSSQIFDLKTSKTIFATEGCAACHRLKGFESNVGFQIEKRAPSFEEVYAEQEWFKQLFPQIVPGGRYNEEIPGSEIVRIIEGHADAIDARIVDDVRQDSILEEINRLYPEVIDSFYSNFRYASRANNDPVWKKRIHRVLMIYIQVYGLGRLIGPNLNWSGLARSDEWLMEHFHNPAGHVPRSIMPVMPFDDTRFYSLINLLDHLAVLNRNFVRSTWDLQGFNPSKAFNLLCVQCHGLSREGNGPVAEWIYPIPKNLRNNEFLRNLTRQGATDSIAHGISGTPMSSWSEIKKAKNDIIHDEADIMPVLTKGEVELLVDWLFSNLPGSETIKNSHDIPKWQYEPKDVINELQNEGGKLDSQLSFQFGKEKKVMVGLFPIFMLSTPPAENKLEVNDLFEIVPNPKPVFNDHLYYIKQKYYTPKNIEEGARLFLLNCAICHGNEGDGSGTRAQIMKEAKPRMLTNLDWISSRDDLRLLRSIKYGVPGTSMTPWGDITTSLQRIQLVIFIRSLSEEKEKREELNKALFTTFDQALFTLEDARISNQNKMDEWNKESELLGQRQKELKLEIIGGKSSSEKDALKIYQKLLEIGQNVKQASDRDQSFLDLKELVKQERNWYQNLGIDLIMKISNRDVLDNFIKMVTLNADRYSLIDGKLVWNQKEESFQQITQLQSEIGQWLSRQLDQFEKEKRALQEKGLSADENKELEENSAQITAYQKLKVRMITDTADAVRAAKSQEEIFKSEFLK